MENFSAKTGKNLIQILMFSLYNDQRIIYREYIQNSFDAIRRAAAEGVLHQAKDGVVDIKIDSDSRRIVIRDNGIGIKAAEVASKLLNIADSHKDGVSSAGQYGIGRLAGAGYCRVLKFITSAYGEDVASTVSFDVDFANQIIHDSQDNSSATEVIDAITKLETTSEDPKEHYFEVILDGVYPDYRDLLNPGIITAYLQESAPIDYSFDFKQAIVHPSLEKTSDPTFKTLWNQTSGVKVFINGGSELRKRYGLKVEGTGDDIDSLDFIKIETDKGDMLAWGWYAITPFTKQIPVSDPNRGIRLRKHNIQLGTSDALNKYFGEVRGNNYFYGEIFAVHPNLRPNSDRSGLAPTPETEILFDKLRLIFKDLGKLYHVANDAKNAVKKVSLAVDKQLQGIDSDIQHMEAEIKSAQAELSKVESCNNAQSEVAKRVIELHKTKAKEKEKEATTHSKTAVKKSAVQTHETPTAAPSNQPPAVTSLKSTDIYEPLKGKFTEQEILLLRRSFTYMTLACPASNKELLEQLKLVSIKKLCDS